MRDSEKMDSEKMDSEKMDSEKQKPERKSPLQELLDRIEAGELPVPLQPLQDTTVLGRTMPDQVITGQVKAPQAEPAPQAEQKPSKPVKETPGEGARPVLAEPAKSVTGLVNRSAVADRVSQSAHGRA